MAERKKTPAKKPTAKRASTKKATAKTASARKAPAKRAPAKRATARTAAAERGEAKTVAELRAALRKNLIKPTETVFLSRGRIEEALDDAVKRGRITRAHARGLAGDLLKRGQKETNDVLRDLEQLLERGRGELGGGVTKARRQASGARRKAVKAAGPVLAQADRACRGAGVGANFPISLYDELNASDVKARLGDLTPAELRKLRDHERRGAKRKGVLDAIESKLK